MKEIKHRYKGMDIHYPHLTRITVLSHSRLDPTPPPIPLNSTIHFRTVPFTSNSARMANSGSGFSASLHRRNKVSLYCTLNIQTQRLSIRWPSIRTSMGWTMVYENFPLPFPSLFPSKIYGMPLLKHDTHGIQHTKQRRSYPGTANSSPSSKPPSDQPAGTPTPSLTGIGLSTPPTLLNPPSGTPN